MIWNILLTAAVFIGMILLWICVYDSNRFVIRRYQIKSKKIKGNYRSVVLADLHNKQYGRGNRILLDAIQECAPDGIWIAGDIPTAVPKKKLDTAISFVSELAKRYPVFYSNGNHEQRMKLYPETYGDMAVQYAEGLAKAGVTPLVNGKRSVKESNITVYGVEIAREYYQRFQPGHMDEEYLKGILGERNATEYTVLLAHNPDYFPAYAEWGADLVISGHVHGGIARIPGWKGVISPRLRLFPEYDGGKFEREGSTMILSRGLGMHTIPVRLFNPAELIVVELTGED